MLIYGLKTCDTCRKARKALPDAEFVDVREQGVPEQVLTTALEKFEAALVNTRSTTWRALNEQQRAMAPIDLLLAHPTLMKRPLIVASETYHLGWTTSVQAALSD